MTPDYPQLVPCAAVSSLLLPPSNSKCEAPSKISSVWRASNESKVEEDAVESPARRIRDRKMARLEAVLLVADGALTFRRLAQLATLADAAEARAFVDQLNESYDRVACSFRVERVATGCRLMTRPQFARWIDRLHNRQALVKLSPAMMETLSIVAYRQPITRAEIEKIRGVQSAEMLKQLMERGYARITGEDDSLGRPFLYGTTRQFLEAFGLRDLDSMPMSDTLRRVVSQEDPEPEEPEPEDSATPELDEPEDEETTDQEDELVDNEAA
jgi:segregation and condensation protein B